MIIMVHEIKITTLKELVQLLNTSPQEVERQSNLLLIFELYQQGSLTLSRVSELAGLKIDEFISEFKRRHLVYVGGPQSTEEAEREYQDVVNYLK